MQSRTRDRLRVRTVAALVGVGLIAIVPATAHADASFAAAPNSMIELSADGIAWSSELADPLFDPAILWVPGDSLTATFFVRNLAETNGWITAEADRLGSTQPLAETDLSLAIRITGGEWQELGGGARTSNLGIVQPGVAPTEVELRATMAPDAGNDTQRGNARFAIHVHLREAVDDHAAGSPSVPVNSGLAESGAARPMQAGVIWWWVAAAAIGVGTALVVDPSQKGRRGQERGRVQ